MGFGKKDIKKIAEAPFEELSERLLDRTFADSNQNGEYFRREDSSLRTSRQERSDPAKVPHLLANLHSYWGDEFVDLIKAMGGSLEIFSFDFRNDIAAGNFPMDVLERTNLDVKKNFNHALDAHIRNAIYFAQISEDYDILCDLPADSPLIPFDNKELINDYRAIGQRRLQAFQEAIKRNGGKESPKDNTVIELFLRVFKKDGVPYALKSASKLTNSGIVVRNYDEGEKLIYIENRPSPEEPGFLDFEGKKQKRIATDTATVGTIRRTYYRDERTTTEVPQRHAEFSAYLITGWRSLNQYVSNHFRTIREANAPLTKEKIDEELGKYSTAA
ncbi:MAG TPA: hypothetical protein VJH90_00510 [archaeon]|nr:hypothetical protein [archaeon]